MNKYFILFLLMIQNLFSVGVTAGTVIKNTAYLDYVVESIVMKSKSNELIDIVDQKLDMNMVCQESSSVIVEPGDMKRTMRFMLTNNGNGEDSYVLTPIEGKSVDFSVSNIAVYIDNDDGIFSEAEDTLVTELTLLADETASLFLVSNIPTDAEKRSSNGLKVDSLIQGDLLYGEFKKLDNFYALVANTEEGKSALCTYEVPSIVLELEKTATLSSDKLYKGTKIHYAIGVKAIGTGTLENVVVKDAIPEGTTYVKGTLKLDGKLVDDSNEVGILVSIGEITQEIENTEILHTITFDVRVD